MSQNKIMMINLISFLGGFLVSSIIDTSLGEFSEWAIVGSSLLVATIESFNNFFYSTYNRILLAGSPNRHLGSLISSLNFFKIGIIYGLIVDAFKLGS